MTAKKPMSSWTMPLVAAAILLLTAAVLVTLWLWVNGQPWTDPEKRTLAQLDVVKVASGIALGGGGLFTLYLAARRQRHQEQAQADINADAEARRITELYTKAVQQLGSPQAPVRLGGLYAFGVEAVFDRASFGQASFHRWESFRRASFGGAVWFTGATFAEGTEADEQALSDLPMFEGATFSDVTTSSAPPPRPPSTES